MILFLLVTTTGLLSAWTEYSAEQNFKTLHFRVLVVLVFGFGYAGIGLTGLLTNLPPLCRRPFAPRVQGLYDYSIFIIPAGLLGFWPTALSIAGVTVLAAMRVLGVDRPEKGGTVAQVRKDGHAMGTEADYPRAAERAGSVHLPARIASTTCFTWLAISMALPSSPGSISAVSPG